MKISRLTVENVTSYGTTTEFVFDDSLNIFIGPNGGGKSNVQKILAVVLSHFFFTQYEFKKDDNETVVRPMELFNKPKLRQALSKYLGNESDQVIELELVSEPSDIENIRLIGNNVEKFNEQLSYWDNRIDDYPPLDHIESIGNGVPHKFTVINHKLQAHSTDGAKYFYQYLTTLFKFMRLAMRIPDIRLQSPIFFFFSERTFGRGLSVQTNQFAETAYFNQYAQIQRTATGENTNLLQFATQHYGRIFWEAMQETAYSEKTVRDILGKSEDVRLLTQYLNRLGYHWDIGTNLETIQYSLVLIKGDRRLFGDMLSSGEKEIFHFLLAMFALNVRDGLVLIDEPELHLHPRWQRIFLSLFLEISKERRNQFVIATHSPVFVDPETLNNITRVYMESLESRHASLANVDLPNKRALVRMINSQNNEKIFFADRVVLVEGITDRLVMESLIAVYARRFSKVEAIEVVEVGGKASFAPYKDLLIGIRTPTFILGDHDYLSICGNEQVRSLFRFDENKADQQLTHKKSKDGRTVMRNIEEALESGDVQSLRPTFQYLQTRFVSRDMNLKAELMALVRENIAALAENGVFVLEHGEIEDYLPEPVSEIGEIVQMCEDPSWILRLTDDAKMLELSRIVCRILDIDISQEGFEALLLARNPKAFETPRSDS